MVRFASIILVSGLGAMSFQAWHLITEGVWVGTSLRSLFSQLGLDRLPMPVDGLHYLLDPLFDQSPAALAVALGFLLLVIAWLTERHARSTEASHVESLRNEAQVRQQQETETRLRMRLRQRIERITRHAA